ncbi:MAG: oligosaccharide flippase family protein [Planctomycetota bacterium]
MSPWRREGGWLVGANVAQQALGVVVLLWLARNIAVDDWGRFALDAAVLGLVATFATARLNVLAVASSDAVWEGGLAQRVIAAMRTEAAAMLALGAAALVVLDRLELGPTLLVVGMAARHLAQQTRAVSERRGRFAPLARRETAALIGGHAAAIACVFAGRPELALYLREAVLGLALAALLLPSLQRAGLVPRAAWLLGPRRFLDLAAHNPAAWLDGILEQVFERVLVLVAGGVAGATGAGLFAQARGLAFRPHQLASPLTNRLSLGWLGRTPDAEERRRAVLTVARRAALPLGGVALVTALAAPAAVPWLLGEPWREAGRALAWMAGFAGGVTLLEFAKAALLVEGRVGDLARVRLAQLAGLGLGLASLAVLEPVAALGAALSMATLAAVGSAYRRLAS